MLIEYKFENYKSFKESNTLSLLGVTSFKEKEKENIFWVQKLKLLKTVAIYGNNASGKSNLVKGLQLMKRFIQTSFRDALLGNTFSIEPFLLNTENEQSTSHFEVIFIHKGIRYRYGFEIDKNKIHAEWLFRTTTKEIPLFERNGQHFKINQTSFKEGLHLETKTRENVLFLSLAAQFNGEISNLVIEWFSLLNFISGINDLEYSTYTIQKLKEDDDFKKWISLIINTLEISNITVEEILLHKKEIDDSDKNTEKLKLNDLQNHSKKIQISTWHRKYDKNNLLTDTVPFDFDLQESEGTKKFIYLLGPWYDSLKNAKVLIVDELDSRLHTHLTKKLIELFQKYNKNNAQLIFTSHDVSLLDKDLFRRDQIWFTEKNQFGESKLYSLADFKTENVRKTSSFFRNYLNGKYGAISFFEIDDYLIQLLYHE